MIQLTQKERQALEFIGTLIREGSVPSVRRLMDYMGYRSTRSASLLIQSLIEKNYLSRRPDGSLRVLDSLDSASGANEDALTVNLPLVGNVPCGSPLLAIENIDMLVPVSRQLVKNPENYFLLRAMGDSMDQEGIDDGDLILVRKQNYADDGDRVVALIDDEATVKVLRKGHNAAVLVPSSSNPIHKPIIVHDDFSVQGVVVASIPSYA